MASWHIWINEKQVRKKNLLIYYLRKFNCGVLITQHEYKKYYIKNEPTPCIITLKDKSVLKTIHT